MIQPIFRPPSSFAWLVEQSAQRGYKPRFHGNGFVQLYITPEYRLHVYHTGLKAVRIENARIHDHRWDLTSIVFLGVLHHSIYEAVFTGAGTHRIIECTGADKTVPMKDRDDLRCNLLPAGHYTMTRGSSYFFPRRSFHKTDFDGITMTMIRKQNDDGNPARVVVPLGLTPDHAFEHQPDTTTLWAAIQDAYEGWSEGRP